MVNLALGQLYQAPITTLLDVNDKCSLWGNIYYDQVRGSLQRNFDWNFCRHRAFAPLIPNYKPPFDYQFAYAFPPNCNRILFIGDDWARYEPRRHEIQGKMIFTNLLPNNEFAGVGFDLGKITMEISNITQANPGIVTVNSTYGIIDGQAVYISGVEGMTQLNGASWTMLSVAANFFTLGDIYGLPADTATFYEYISGGVIQTWGPVQGQSGTPPNSIPVIFSMDVTDVTQFDQLFIDTFKLALALELCMPVTGDRGLLADINARLKVQLAEAVAINHQERPVIVTERRPVADMRYMLSDSGGGREGGWGYGGCDE